MPGTHNKSYSTGIILTIENFRTYSPWPECSMHAYMVWSQKFRLTPASLERSCFNKRCTYSTTLTHILYSYSDLPLDLIFKRIVSASYFSEIQAWTSFHSIANNIFGEAFSIFNSGCKNLPKVVISYHVLVDERQVKPFKINSTDAQPTFLGFSVQRVLKKLSSLGNLLTWSLF